MSSEAKKFAAPKLEAPGALSPTSSAAPAVEQRAVAARPKFTDNELGRRRVPRRAVENRVGILHRGMYYIGWVHEVGEGGLLISSPEPLNKGDRVVLTVRIPDCFNGVIMGTIVYALNVDPADTKEARYGIKFEDIDFENKRRIRHFVASARTYVV